MLLSYDEFKAVVPKETARFMDIALPYIGRYSKNGLYLRFKGDEYTDNYYAKMLYLLIYSLGQMEEYKNFFSRYGFNESKFKIELKEPGSNDEIYLQAGSLIPDYQDETKYEQLMPLDIVLKAFEQYNKYVYSDEYSLLGDLVPRASGLDRFKNDLIEYNNGKKIEMEQQLEQELYSDLPITVISYLETASKIRTLLLQKIGSSQVDILKKTEEDIVPLSLLLALQHYKDTPIYQAENIGEQKAISSLLESKGVTFDKIYNAIYMQINSRDVRDTQKNIVAIKNLYMRYCQEGIYQDEKNRQVTVSGVLSNALDRSFTNSFVIEKTLAKLNCYVGMFDSLEEKVKSQIELERRNYSEEYVKNFYNELSKEAMELANFTAKTYMLVLSQMKNKGYSSKILCDEDDADTLALLIATYFFDGDVSKFYIDYGITLEKILQLLNLNITKEQIEAMELDQKILVDRYMRYFYEGVNRSKSRKSLTINDVAYNLCNRSFNRSMIMEDIFSYFVSEVDLNQDFLSQIQTHLQTKEQMRKMNLTQKLFRDLPVESMEYLENTSRIHQYLLKNLKGWNEEDLKSLSLLLAIFVSSQKEVANFFEKQGFTLGAICSYLGINSYNIINDSIDIDLLHQEYDVYIFGGKNQSKERKDLDVLTISQNIFSKEINNSVMLSKLLGHFNFSYEQFEQIEVLYQEYLQMNIEEKKKEEAKETINGYSSSNTCAYLRNAIRIYQRAVINLKNGIGNQELLTTEEDLAEFAMILSLFTIGNESQRFFIKNNINLSEFLRICNLNPDFIENLEREDIDYIEGVRIFSRYIKNDISGYGRQKTVDDIAKRIFDTNINSSLFLEQIASQESANYDILKEEVEVGRDYELTLTTDDRIALLATSSIDVLDLNDVKSVLHFGNSLSVHSKYIHDELPRLMLSDVHQASLDTINGIINKVYTEEVVPKKPQGFFARLFAISVDEEKTKMVFNPHAIQELKDAIDTNITSLSKELLGYDTIRKYIEVYRRKNRSYYLLASEMSTKLNEELSTLDPHDDSEYAQFLNVSSQLQIMNDKANRFATTSHLMQQELLKVNQAIVNHFITINALEMARDDLLPLVGSELALTKGRETENQSLELSQNIIQLFQSLLDRNVEGAVHNMEQLKNSTLSSAVYAALNRDIEVYLQGLNQATAISDRIEVLDIDSLESTQKTSLPSPSPIELTLNPDTSKQKQKVMQGPYSNPNSND